MKLSSEDLRAFLVLAEEKSFTRAAVRCHKSQSAFSARIRVLEETLGARLFDRTTRMVELTVEGTLFRDSARQIYGEFSDMIDNFRDYAARRKGRVSIAALPSLAASWLPPIFAGFRQLHPGIDLTLTDTLSEHCLELVRNGHADLAITSARVNAEDLESTFLATERFFLIHRHDHPLAGLAQVRLEDLTGHGLVQMAGNSSVRQQVDAALYPAAPATVLEVRYLATAAAMVQAGMGITLMPALTLGQFRHPDLVIRDIEGEGLDRPLHLVRRRGRILSVAAEAAYRYMQQERSSLVRLCRAGRD